MLSQTDQDRLVELLEKCAVLHKDGDRLLIIKRLPELIRKVETTGGLRVFLARLVDVAASYPNGLHALAEAVRFFEGETIHMQAVDDFLAEVDARSETQGNGRPVPVPPVDSAASQPGREPTAPPSGSDEPASLPSAETSAAGPTESAGRGRWWLAAAGLAVATVVGAYLAGRGGSDSAGASTDTTETVKLKATKYRPAMIALAGGRFRMGTPEIEEGRDDDEGPRQWVTLSPFWMCRTEITQAQWKAMMGKEPSDCDYGCGDELPVQNVSWSDVVDYMNELSRLEELTPCYERTGTVVRWKDECDGYRLPTEAEWEYAARAGSDSAYGFGDDAGELGEYAWYAANADGKTHAVATKKPNAWGLYDMHGNVWEWVWDEYGKYQAGSRSDPRGPASAAEPDTAHTEPDSPVRVLRGGSFEVPARFLRSGSRVRYWPRNRDGDLGARCARAAPPASTP
ncbi:SUMF1/EgtB/PvdO family nonheme iron enzyme [Haliangium sp.]|uniref:SUMF1/EgtB/PvdO family nonheme iron enzyme n=1 Tax=Haliangium sp. TaxID=2663208 RepID=UPI003D0BFBFF